MKFYKVHAVKFKSQKVLFVPEKFDEIGPDAFRQTRFDIIVLSRKVKTIRNYAFSDLKECKVYIPKTVNEIETLAFENIDIGNEFYCVNGSEAYKACVENELKVNEDIETFIEYAETLRLEEEKRLKKIAERKKSTQVEIDNKEKGKKRELTDIQKSMETKENKPQIVENQADVILETTEEPKVANEVVETLIKEDNEDLFVEKFGLPPAVDFYSDMGEKWKKQISQMNTENIITNYDSNEYCAEYRYYCYIEMKNRFLSNKLEVESDDTKEKNTVMYDNIVEHTEIEEIDDVQDDDEILALLGLPPKCPKASEFNEEWKNQIKSLSTLEILERYDSEDWCEEYRLLCYVEIATRSDLADVLFN